MLGAAETCCASNVGLNFDGGLQIGDSVADVQVISKGSATKNGKPRSVQSVFDKLLQAAQVAVHPDSAGSVQAAQDWADSGGGDGHSNVIPFPVKSPYHPLTQPRSPVTGLTAFPHTGYYFNGEPVNDFNTNGDEEIDGPMLEGLGSLGNLGTIQSAWDSVADGVALPSRSGFRGLGSLGMQWEGVIGQLTQVAPGIISAVKGQPYYDPSQSSNPQLTKLTYAPPVSREAPPGYRYSESGQLIPVSSAANLGGGLGAGVAGIGNSLSAFVQENPMLLLGGGVLLLFLFMKPPSRR